MATMNVSLPAAMKEWVESRSADGRYSNASDYVRDLIREDQERTEKLAAMQRHIDEAWASGVSESSLEDIRQDVLKELDIGDEVRAKRKG